MSDLVRVGNTQAPWPGGSPCIAPGSSPSAGAASLCLLAASGLSLARLSASLSSSEAKSLPRRFADPAPAERHVSWQGGLMGCRPAGGARTKAAGPVAALEPLTPRHERLETMSNLHSGISHPHAIPAQRQVCCFHSFLARTPFWQKPKVRVQTHHSGAAPLSQAAQLPQHGCHSCHSRPAQCCLQAGKQGTVLAAES